MNRKVMACLLCHRSTTVDDALGAEQSVLDTVMKLLENEMCFVAI